ncbi:MAG: hypothetical protein Q7J77_04580 [Undibacterium sp.]|nr:hypothetical protein [Undibacterium sp.]
MYLVKYTAKRWRDAALSQTSLRIGSVLHYREIVDARFRDENEGDGRIVHRANTPLIAEDHNRIFSEHPYRLTDGWTIETGGAPLLSEKSEFNVFVFSCSLLQRNHEIPKLAQKFKSDARYFIKDPLGFAEAVAEGLKNYLAVAMRDAHMHQSAREKLHLLEVLPVFGPVKYTTDLKDRFVTEANIETFRSKQLRLQPFFQKGPKFQDEQEFRFVWLINLGSMENDDFDLTTTNLRTVDLENLAAPISGKPCSLSGIYNRRGLRIV